jgi:hypothetical protein
LWFAHFRMARLVNSVPLSLTMDAGLPNSRTSASNSRATRATRDAGVGHQAEVFAAAIVVHGQDAEFTRRTEGVGYEVQ